MNCTLLFRDYIGYLVTDSDSPESIPKCTELDMCLDPTRGVNRLLRLPLGMEERDGSMEDEE